MNQAEWMINPRNGIYLAHVFVRGMHLYTSGRNLRILAKNLKQQAYKNNLPYSSVGLSMKPSTEIDFTYATPMFMSRYVNKIDPRLMQLSEAKKLIRNNEESKPKLFDENLARPIVDYTPTRQQTFKHITRVENGQLVVYKVEEVCRYDLMEEDKTKETVVDNVELN